MKKLEFQTCVSCKEGSPGLTPGEIKSLMGELPEWEVIARGGIKRLTRIFQFKNFAQALAFTNAVGDLAEKEGHHPALLSEWGKVTVTFWTHKIRGLHRNDLVMAAKTNLLYDSLRLG